MIRLAFTDPIRPARECHLVVPPNGRLHPAADEPKVGVEHPGCTDLADISVELDAFYCPACGWNGRISGAWVMDMLEAWKEAGPQDRDRS